MTRQQAIKKAELTQQACRTCQTQLGTNGRCALCDQFERELEERCKRRIFGDWGLPPAWVHPVTGRKAE